MSGWDQIRIVPGKYQPIGYERIMPQHGEVDFRVVSDRGYETISMTEDAARWWAERWTRGKGNGERFWVQSQIVGVTDWADCNPDSSTGPKEER